MRKGIVILIVLIGLIGFASNLLASELSIQLRDAGEYIIVKNVGNCPIYKLSVNTVPPKKEGALNFLSRLGAETLGLSSFAKDIGTLEKYDEIKIYRYLLVNNDGQKLNNRYVVGSWYFTGTSCGEYNSVSFVGD